MANSQEKKLGEPDEKPEEDKLDEEILKEKVDDEIRQQVIEKYGLDELEHIDLIEQLVEDQKEFSKKLSTAIKQKRRWREEAYKKEAPKEQKKEEIPPSDIERLIDERFDQRELEASNLSDELKREAQAYARSKGARIREALNSPYIQFLKTEEEKKQKEEAASLGFKAKRQAVRDFSGKSPKDFDLTTEEGRKGYEEYKNWLKS